MEGPKDAQVPVLLVPTHSTKVPSPMSRRKGDPRATPVPTTEGQVTSIFSCLAPKLPNVAPFQAFQ